ncbi:MAG: pseudouridine synthase [Gemmobacter sp.]|jgi:23S rRNA pseudouridine2605 synthase|nr:pseudouridine synthase [Gemmobacter sp.]
MPEQAKPKSPAKPASKPDDKRPEGERIAKVLSRAGLASRREAERLIEAGEVKVNGRIITSPALNVTAKDRITVHGQPLAAKEPARLWLYYKPEGLVTSAADEKGRETVFDTLPPEMPRVMSIGRLDLNSEGLLLLTNDGGLKRRLELPSTGWLRKYRVRVHGTPEDNDLEPLRKGIAVEGETFQPMQVTLDRVQGANAWLTVGLREGRNREVRRAMAAVGLVVNRLIRISYGPFRLGEMQPGEVAEVKPRILRDQLGFDPDETPGSPPGEGANEGGVPSRKPAKASPGAHARGKSGAKLLRSDERYLDAIGTEQPEGPMSRTRRGPDAQPRAPIAKPSPRKESRTETGPKSRAAPPPGKAPPRVAPDKPPARGTAAKPGTVSGRVADKSPAGAPTKPRSAGTPARGAPTRGRSAPDSPRPGPYSGPRKPR